MFLGLVETLGGLASNDTYESAYSTWAIAHLDFSCALPSGYRVTAPLYPLLSGAFVALTHVGASVPFPGHAAMGPHCYRSYLLINQWSLKSGALADTVRFGWIGWFVLMAGIIAFLRTTSRGRTRWEPATLIFLACAPPVWLCLESTFHPQDLIAMGLGLGALASGRNGKWLMAGALMALAILAQQFALLIAIPLFVVSPGVMRIRFAASTIATMTLVSLPLLATNPGGAVHSIFFGTGNTGGVGGTVLWELHLHGASLVVLSRILPIVLAMLLAVWTVRRVGRVALEPQVLVPLIAVALSLRLVFEQQMNGYYYMALSAMLVLLDVVRGRPRVSFLAWLVIVSMVFILGSDALDSLQPLWDTVASNGIPLVVLLGAVGMTVGLARHRRHSPWALTMWIGMMIAALLVWDKTDVLGNPPAWFWQIFLVPTGILLAGGPLVTEVRMCVEGDSKYVSPPTATRKGQTTSQLRVG